MSTEWIVSPQYRIHYCYYWWAGKRYIKATVYLKGWGLLFSAMRLNAKDAYKAAQRAVRTYREPTTGTSPVASDLS